MTKILYFYDQHSKSGEKCSYGGTLIQKSLSKVFLSSVLSPLTGQYAMFLGKFTVPALVNCDDQKLHYDFSNHFDACILETDNFAFRQGIFDKQRKSNCAPVNNHHPFSVRDCVSLGRYLRQRKKKKQHIDPIGWVSGQKKRRGAGPSPSVSSPSSPCGVFVSSHAMCAMCAKGWGVSSEGWWMKLSSCKLTVYDLILLCVSSET